MAGHGGEDFLVPAVKVTLGGRDLVEELGACLEQVNVVLDLRGESSAEIVLWDCYDVDGHTVTSGLKTALMPGSLLDVFLGYQSSTKKVFSGYLYSAGLDISEKGYTVLLKGCDVVRLMKESRHTRCFQNDTHSAVFREVMKPYAWLCSVSADDTEAMAVGDVRMQDGEDYEFVTEELAGAETAGWEFYVQNGTASFAKSEESPDASLTLKPDSGVRKLSAFWSFLNTTVTVQGCGSDHTVYTADVAAKAAVLDKKAGAGAYFRSIPCLDSGEKVKAWAAAEADGLKGKTKKASVSLAGTPELLAGNYVSLEEFDSYVNGRYRIVKAVHVLDEEGYRTEAELEGG